MHNSSCVLIVVWIECHWMVENRIFVLLEYVVMLNHILTFRNCMLHMPSVAVSSTWLAFPLKTPQLGIPKYREDSVIFLARRNSFRTVTDISLALHWTPMASASESPIVWYFSDGNVVWEGFPMGSKPSGTVDTVVTGGDGGVVTAVAAEESGTFFIFNNWLEKNVYDDLEFFSLTWCLWCPSTKYSIKKQSVTHNRINHCCFYAIII